MRLRSAGIYVFPWDFADEGLNILMTKFESLGLTRIYLVSAYHAGFFVYPHNPRRKVHLLEDGMTYFHPNENSFDATPLKPKVASLCRDLDWFGTICKAAEQHNLEVSAWTVCLHNTRLGLLHPDCAIHNAFGDPYPHALTPAHPAVKEYVRSLVIDLCEHYALHSILLEAPDYRRRAHGGSWVSGHHHERCGVHLRPLEEYLFSLSFNPEDVRQATAEGVNVELIRNAVKQHLETYFAKAPSEPADLPRNIQEFRVNLPALEAYENHFHRVEADLLELLGKEAKPRGVKLIATTPHPAIDIVQTSAHGENPERISAVIRQAAATLSSSQELLVSIRMGFNGPGMGRAILSIEDMNRSIRAVSEGGTDAIGFYNYGEAPRQSIEWIRPALHDIGFPAKNGDFQD